MENQQTEERLATLFAKNKTMEGSGAAQDGADEPYLSVNEGLTTDTAITTDMDGEDVATRAEGTQAASEDEQDPQGILSDPEEETPAGIASSEEEEPEHQAQDANAQPDASATP